MKLNLRGLLLTSALACMCTTFLFAEQNELTPNGKGIGTINHPNNSNVFPNGNAGREDQVREMEFPTTMAR